jgi:hypothetical protein
MNNIEMYLFQFLNTQLVNLVIQQNFNQLTTIQATYKMFQISID